MIKLGKSETVSHTFYNDDVVADAGTVTVTVKNADDETVHTGSTTKTGNVYSFTLPAQDELGRLSILWNGTILDETTYVEIIEDYLFELWELDALLATRGYGKTYTAYTKKAVRDAVAETFESVTKTSFFGRRRSAVLEVSGGAAFTPTVDVRQVVSVDGAAFTGDVTASGCLTGLNGSTAAVVYEYGLAVSAEARVHALELAVWLLGAQTRRTPDNAESLTDQNGSTYRLALAGTRGIEIPIPSVDAFLKRYKFEMPGVA